MNVNRVDLHNIDLPQNMMDVTFATIWCTRSDYASCGHGLIYPAHPRL